MPHDLERMKRGSKKLEFASVGAQQMVSCQIVKLGDCPEKVLLLFQSSSVDVVLPLASCTLVLHETID